VCKPGNFPGKHHIKSDFGDDWDGPAREAWSLARLPDGTFRLWRESAAAFAERAAAVAEWQCQVQREVDEQAQAKRPCRSFDFDEYLAGVMLTAFPLRLGRKKRHDLVKAQAVLERLRARVAACGSLCMQAEGAIDAKIDKDPRI
jgi:hypothetical protein